MLSRVLQSIRRKQSQISSSSARLAAVHGYLQYLQIDRLPIQAPRAPGRGGESVLRADGDLDRGGPEWQQRGGRRYHEIRPRAKSEAFFTPLFAARPRSY